MRNFLKLTLFSTFLLVGCSRVQFENIAQNTNGPEQGLTQPDPSQDTRLCEGFESLDEKKWIAVGMVKSPCEELCPDGSIRECQGFQEKEIICQNGEVHETGQLRFQEPVIPIQNCPELPKDCGTHPNNSKWWQESGSLEKTCEICPAGENHQCRMSIEIEMTCIDGKTQATSITREGKFLEFINVCQPLPPKSCGQHTSGDSWWESSGTELAACLTCWDSQIINCEYAKESEKLCRDGVISNSGQVRRAEKIRQIGECRAEPKNCGQLSDGNREWRNSGRTQIIDCDKCPDGSTRKCLQAIDEEIICHSGNVSNTGNTRPGSILDYVGRCPENTEEKSESVVSGHIVGKADVLFLLDTTGSMFTSLNNLGERFQALTSGWGRIDWRIAITNTKVQKHFLESWALNGSPIELQKNDEAKPREFIIRSESRFAEDWFYRTVSRDPSDKGCSTQPYCMMSPSEPLRAIVGAISKRNDPEYSGFFRPGSQLITVIISDEDEKEGQSGAATSSMVQKYFNQNLSGRMRGLTGMSIIIRPGDSDCLKRHKSIWDGVGNGSYGVELEKFARITGGVSASLCSKDYGGALAKLAEKVRQELSSITLKKDPVANSVKIEFSPNVNISWTVSGRRIDFNKPVPAGTKITIRYLVKK